MEKNVCQQLRDHIRRDAFPKKSVNYNFMNPKYFFIILSVLLVNLATAQQRNLIDPLATKETKALFNNLYKLSEKHTLFGHQHATE